MKNEKTLSDKIQDRKYPKPIWNTRFTLDVEDVREFIQKILRCDWIQQTQIDDIKELAGEELANHSPQESDSKSSANIPEDNHDKSGCGICATCGHEEREHRTYPVKINKKGLTVAQVPLKNTKCNHREMGEFGYEDCKCKKFKPEYKCVNCGEIRNKHKLSGECLPLNRYRGKKFKPACSGDEK